MKIVSLVLVFFFSTLHHQLLFAQDSCDRSLRAGNLGTKITKPSKQELETIQRVLELRTSLQKSILEREYLIDLSFLALIAKEHLLMVGSPGNAKSMLAKSFFESILFESKEGDEISFWTIMMSQETTLADTHGPYDFKKLSEKSVYKRHLDNGILSEHFVFLDEFLDAPIKTLRTGVLQALNERTYSEGGEILEGKLWTAFAATNYSLPEAYAMAEKMNMPPNTLKAILDRFAFVAYVPKGTALAETDHQLFTGNFQVNDKTIYYRDVEYLNKKMEEVLIPRHISEAYSVLKVRFEKEIDTLEVNAFEEYYKDVMAGRGTGMVPFKGTKFMSNRTSYKAGKVLKAIVVFDWVLLNGERSLEANFDDLEKLESFLTLNGPESEQLEIFSSHAIKQDEKQQLTYLEMEKASFRNKAINPLYDDVSREVQRHLQSFLVGEKNSNSSGGAEPLNIDNIVKLSEKRKGELKGYLEKSFAELPAEMGGATADRTPKVALMYLRYLLDRSE